MTRFQQEISGKLGEWWQREAVRDVVEKVKDADENAIVDEDGAIRWKSNDSYLMDDFCEVLEYAGYKFSREVTKKKRKEQTDEFLREYRKNPPRLTAEDLAEMRNAFGEGEVVVDVITGRRIQL